MGKFCYERPGGPPGLKGDLRGWGDGPVHTHLSAGHPPVLGHLLAQHLPGNQPSPGLRAPTWVGEGGKEAHPRSQCTIISYIRDTVLEILKEKYHVGQMEQSITSL